MNHILVVDDEQDLLEILQFNLTNEGFEVTTAASAEEALRLISQQPPHTFSLILLDVMMDQMSGFEMAENMRQQGNDTPIIFLTARDSHDDQLAGFHFGADDYITKPFAFDTVLARIKAVLKRSQPPADTKDPQTLTFNSLKFDFEQNTILLHGEPLELTRREYLILSFLAKSPDKCFTREEIMTHVWPNDALVNDRSVDVHIARLRKKLKDEGSRLINRTGFGYTFSTKR